jgi:ketosteroid isomerase-like protein
MDRDPSPAARESLRIVGQIIDAVGGRDVSRLIELTDPDVEWRSFLAELMGGGVYRGHDGIRQYVKDLDDAWEIFEIYMDDGIEVGQMVLMLGRIRYRGRESKVETESSAGWLIKLREGRMVFVRALRDPEAVLEAAARRD